MTCGRGERARICSRPSGCGPQDIQRETCDIQCPSQPRTTSAGATTTTVPTATATDTTSPPIQRREARKKPKGKKKGKNKKSTQAATSQTASVADVLDTSTLPVPEGGRTGTITSSATALPSLTTLKDNLPTGTTPDQGTCLY